MARLASSTHSKRRSNNGLARQVGLGSLRGHRPSRHSPSGPASQTERMPRLKCSIRDCLREVSEDGMFCAHIPKLDSSASCFIQSRTLVTRCAAEIEPKRIDYLWPGRIARGKHTSLAGEPGDGKSQLSVYVAAAISRGGEWPCGEGRAPIGNVIILNAEDGADDTVVPRLIAAGANRERVHIVSAVLQNGGKG